MSIKIIREAICEWVNRSFIPIIDDSAQNHNFPQNLIKEMGEIGAFGPNIPEKYGGAGMDQVAYGIIITELERG